MAFIWAEKRGILVVVGNTLGTRVDLVASSFQKIPRGWQLARYILPPYRKHMGYHRVGRGFDECCLRIGGIAVNTDLPAFKSPAIAA